MSTGRHGNPGGDGKDHSNDISKVPTHFSCVRDPLFGEVARWSARPIPAYLHPCHVTFQTPPGVEVPLVPEALQTLSPFLARRLAADVVKKSPGKGTFVIVVNDESFAVIKVCLYQLHHTEGNVLIVEFNPRKVKSDLRVVQAAFRELKAYLAQLGGLYCPLAAQREEPVREGDISQLACDEAVTRLYEYEAVDSSAGEMRPSSPSEDEWMGLLDNISSSSLEDVDTFAYTACSYAPSDLKSLSRVLSLEFLADCWSHAEQAQILLRFFDHVAQDPMLANSILPKIAFILQQDLPACKAVFAQLPNVIFHMITCTVVSQEVAIRLLTFVNACVEDERFRESVPVLRESASLLDYHMGREMTVAH